MGQLQETDAHSRIMTGVAGKYLTFALSRERYAVQILKIQEIIGLMNITTVPGTPHYLKGIINLRGRIIPVIDLRLKFGLPEAEYDEKTCIIVANTVIKDKAISVGVVVDTVLEVTTLDDKAIEPPPEYGLDLSMNFLLGIGHASDNGVIILIDIDRALSDASGITADYSAV
jgi:purine-binding chemotaxis protein CheW